MATNATWVVVFEDKTVIKNIDEGANEGIGYAINDNTFWNQSKFSNIWAIQYETANASDQVEFRDTTPHCSYADANLGDFQEFITRWDAAHLAKMQEEWDYDNVDGESESEKIDRLGARPTSYSSS